MSVSTRRRWGRCQGYLAREQLPPPRTLQLDYAEGPMVILGGGRVLMSQVPHVEQIWHTYDGPGPDSGLGVQVKVLEHISPPSLFARKRNPSQVGTTFLLPTAYMRAQRESLNSLFQVAFHLPS